MEINFDNGWEFQDREDWTFTLFQIFYTTRWVNAKWAIGIILFNFYFEVSY